MMAAREKITKIGILHMTSKVLYSLLGKALANGE